jgi:hypothetical protein
MYINIQLDEANRTASGELETLDKRFIEMVEIWWRELRRGSLHRRSYLKAIFL